MTEAAGCFGEGGDALLLSLLLKARTRTGERRGKGEGLAAGVLAVFSGIHYLARLKIHQRLPRFQHMVHLNFTASCSQQLSLI